MQRLASNQAFRVLPGASFDGFFEGSVLGVQGGHSVREFFLENIYFRCKFISM